MTAGAERAPLPKENKVLVGEGQDRGDALIPRQNSALGRVQVVLGYGLSIIGVLCSLTAFALLQPNSHKSVWHYVSGAGLTGLAFVIFYFGSRMLRWGRRHHAPVIPVGVPAGDFVLFLRSFADDVPLGAIQMGFGSVPGGPGAVKAPRINTELENLCAALAPFGQVVAVGRPGEQLPELGASRMYLPLDNWQGTVLQLMQRARLVVLSAGAGVGLRWELQQAVHHLHPERLLLLIQGPPANYHQFRQEMEHLFPAGLPEDPTPSRPLDQFRGLQIRGLVHFDFRWRPELMLLPWDQPPPRFRRPFEAVFTGGLQPVLARHNLPLMPISPEEASRRFQRRVKIFRRVVLPLIFIVPLGVALAVGGGSALAITVFVLLGGAVVSWIATVFLR